MSLPSLGHMWNNLFILWILDVDTLEKGRGDGQVSYLESEAVDSEPGCRLSREECHD